MKNPFAKYEKLLGKQTGNVSARVVEKYVNSYYTQENAESLKITAEIIGKSLVFTTKGRWVSLNFIVSKSSWASSMNLKDIVKAKVRKAIEGMDVKMERFRIVVRYNSKLDDHNTVMMPKWFTDAIKTTRQRTSDNRLMEDDEGKALYELENGVIEDDNKHYSKGTTLEPDPSLPHNTYIIAFIPIEKQLYNYDEFRKRLQSDDIFQ